MIVSNLRSFTICAHQLCLNSVAVPVLFIKHRTERVSEYMPRSLPSVADAAKQAKNSIFAARLSLSSLLLASESPRV